MERTAKSPKYKKPSLSDHISAAFVHGEETAGAKVQGSAGSPTRRAENLRRVKSKKPKCKRLSLSHKTNACSDPETVVFVATHGKDNCGNLIIGKRREPKKQSKGPKSTEKQKPETPNILRIQACAKHWKPRRLPKYKAWGLTQEKNKLISTSIGGKIPKIVEYKCNKKCKLQ